MIERTNPLDLDNDGPATTSEQIPSKDDISNTDPLDSKIAFLIFERPSITDQEIADKIGLSRQTVNRRRKSRLVQEIIREMIAIPEREVRRLTAKAMIRLEALIDHDDPRIQLTATMAFVRMATTLMTKPFFGIDRYQY